MSNTFDSFDGFGTGHTLPPGRSLGPSSVISKTVLCDILRLRIGQTSLEVIAPMVANSMEMITYTDRYMNHTLLSIEAKIASGEIEDSTRTVEETVHIDVFASWTDHLKYRIKQHKHCPAWVGKRLTIRYQKIHKKVSVTVPVKLLKVCPHPTRFDSNDAHLRFLVPTQFENRYRTNNDESGDK